MNNSVQNLKALVVGSTGAIGQELVKELVVSQNWSEVHVIARKEHESWNQFSQEQRQKLKIVKVENFDNLQDASQFNNFKNINSVFCCLGAVQKNGKENFIKVDQLYPQYVADIALKNKIPQYHIVTSQKADKHSIFFYFRIKGEVEYLLQQKNLNYLGIYRPGFLLNRTGQRFVEKVCSYIPFIKKIDVRDVAKAMRIQAEKNNNLKLNTNKTEIFENDDIINVSAIKK
ncbi:hypothetical protein ABPG72_001739 [Tetrahymena utriculariae]